MYDLDGFSRENRVIFLSVAIDPHISVNPPTIHTKFLQTGEMEVKNPLFHDDPTPATPKFKRAHHEDDV